MLSEVTNKKNDPIKITFVFVTVGQERELVEKTLINIIAHETMKHDYSSEKRHCWSNVMNFILLQGSFYT